MKLEKFTQNWRANLSQGLMVGFLGLFMLLSTNQASAQCPLVCNNNVQISLDDDCQVEVTPDMILEGQGPISCNYRVVIKDLNGYVIPGSPIVGPLWVGRTLQVGVYNGPNDTDNNCWGYIHIEDKIRPAVVCPDTMYVECYAAPAVYPLPNGIDNCDGNVTVVEISDETVNLDCDDEYSAKRTIVYQATDDSGNVSDYCYRVIYYIRVNLVDIEWPVNYDGSAFPDSSMLSCSAPAGHPFWDLNGNYYPDPDETGAPHTASGTSVYGDFILCELNVVYGDEVIQICANSYKVLRQWTVMDWCTGDIEQRFQVIKVMDSEGPIVTAMPDDFEAYTHPYLCTASFLVPPPITVSDCDENWTYTVSYKLGNGSGIAPPGIVYTTLGVTGNSTIGYTLNNIPGGIRVWIKYTVTDDCGNSTDAFSEVDVIDNTPPVPVCDQFTVVTLTNTGEAYVEALSFDDGSHDNCSDVTFQVRRMAHNCVTLRADGSKQTNYGDYIIFCCADLTATEIMVELEVSDANGNTNTCMVNVTVQDKIKAVITCPADIEIDCTDDIDDLNLTGTATVVDNCGNPNFDYEDLDDVDNCGVGTIRRKWKVYNADGSVDHSCIQKIYVINHSPFAGVDKWPINVDLDGCMAVDTDPSNTGEPEYTDNACSLVAHTYEDQVFTFVDDACFKILRHWTVIDWCVYDQSGGAYGIYGPYTQIIKVFDNDAPVLGSCADLELCIYEASDVKCGGPVDLIQTATDDCSGINDDLTWSYTVESELNSSGIFVYLKAGNNRDASGYFETGSYRVKWVVEDNCGNFENCTQYFDVLDCKKPTPYCLGEVTTVVMNNSGTIETWASDFDLGSYDNCPGELKFSFSGTSYVPNKTFGCDELGLNSVQMWVWDEAGNKDFCEVIINIQDHSNACPGSASFVNIAGMIRNQENVPMMGAPVVIEETEQAPEMHQTDEDGAYKFSQMTLNGDFKISVEGGDDYMNGISTLDLLLIQRHILKLKKFTTAYTVIAADVDGNEKINAKDIIDLRKLILGKYNEFPTNDSWRFVVANQSFADIESPFPFTEEINLSDVAVNNNTNHFVSVKVGDVNGDVEMNMANVGQSETRNLNTFGFNASEVQFQAGEQVRLNLTAAEMSTIAGFQFTLDFNSNVLSYDNIEQGAINIDESHVGSSLSARGKVNVSWSDVKEAAINKDQGLFTVVFTALTDGQLSDVLELNSTKTSAELYNGDLETYNLNLNFNNKVELDEEESFELFQNEPNPFVDNTSIRFVLPNASSATLKVYDLTGKVLVNITKNFNKGENRFDIGKDQLNVSGILYYQLEADKFTATKKMILMSK